MPKTVHLINDEKFLPRFIERAEDLLGTGTYVVFGSQPPYRFLGDSPNVVTSATPLSDGTPVRDVFIHFLTYQKIKWVEKYAPEARVHWVYFGSDLYELLTVFHGFQLYSKKDAPGGFLPHVSGANFKAKAQRFLQLAVYQRHFARFLKNRLTTFRFWNPGDFDLLTSAFATKATFRFFQYGAYLESDIDFVKSVRKTTGERTALNILVNHSGTRSGNHLDILDRIDRKVLGEGHQLHATLSYGDTQHIETVKDYGKRTFGDQWNGYYDFMPRLNYYELLSTMDIAIFGHRRQEAGNSLFISMLLGTKVFVHPDSVLIPYLEQHGFHFATLDTLSSDDWTTALSEEQKEHNKAAALAYFDPKRIEAAYQTLLD